MTPDTAAATDGRVDLPGGMYLRQIKPDFVYDIMAACHRRIGMLFRDEDALAFAAALAPSTGAGVPAGVPCDVLGRPRLQEDLSQFLHDEVHGHGWTWPEHEDDTGRREDGYVRLTPTDVRLECRDQALRIWGFLGLDRLAASPEPTASVPREAGAPDGGAPVTAEAATAAMDGRVERSFEAMAARLRQVINLHHTATDLDKAGAVDALTFALTGFRSADARGDAILAALAPSTGAGVPAGYKLVPIEPTPEMREAFHIAHARFEDCKGDASPDDQWAAMLAASPEPAASVPRETGAPDGGWVEGVPLTAAMRFRGYATDVAVEAWGPGVPHEEIQRRADAIEHKLLSYFVVEARPYLDRAVKAEAELAALRASRDGGKVQAELRRWRHKKRGTVYEEVGRAELQSSDVFSDPSEGDTLVVYRDEDGKLWARLDREFEDGRFVRVPDARP